MMIQLTSLAFVLGAFVANAVNCGTSTPTNTVNIYSSGDYRWITSNGCPDYDWSLNEGTPNSAQVKNFTVRVPRYPKISENTKYIGVYKDKDQTISNQGIPMGILGFAVNGVALFGNADATGGDAYENEGRTFNDCGGHADPFSIYHYHAETGSGCVYTDSDGKHSPIFGIMLDGIPIFGVKGDGGVVPTDLDECNGHVDETYPFYHYHIQDGLEYPYLINCMKGCIQYRSFSSDFSGTLTPSATCTEADTQYDYSSLDDIIAGAEVPDSTTSSTSEEEASSGLTGGQVAGIIVGVLGSVALVGGAVAYFKCKKPRYSTMQGK